jgi:fibronectin-binding autotransporter adhesin
MKYANRGRARIGRIGNVVNADGVVEVGRVGGMAVVSDEQRIGPYEQTATGGRINGTANVTGATTLSSTLGVTGTSNLSNTNIGGAANFNTTASVNGAWLAAVDDVEASASGTYEVNETDYILFVTWSGGNGTFTIALPPIESSEGRMIRIKTDSTISNSTALSITPDDGDTGVLIDGESSSSMTRSYDGATYLAHNGEWWVIQKKDK